MYVRTRAAMLLVVAGFPIGAAIGQPIDSFWVSPVSGTGVTG